MTSDSQTLLKLLEMIEQIRDNTSLFLNNRIVKLFQFDHPDLDYVDVIDTDICFKLADELSQTPDNEEMKELLSMLKDIDDTYFIIVQIVYRNKIGAIVNDVMITEENYTDIDNLMPMEYNICSIFLDLPDESFIKLTSEFNKHKDIDMLMMSGLYYHVIDIVMNLIFELSQAYQQPLQSLPKTNSPELDRLNTILIQEYESKGLHDRKH